MIKLFKYIEATYSDNDVQAFIKENSLLKKQGKMGEELYLLNEDESLSILIENEENFVVDLYHKIDFEKDDFVLTTIFIEKKYIEKFGFPLEKSEFLSIYGCYDSYNDISESFKWIFDEKLMFVNFEDDKTKSVQLQFRKNITL